MEELKNRYKFIFERLLEMTDDGFVVVDSEGIVTEINQQYCDFFGTQKSNVIGKCITELIPNTKMLEIVKNKFCEEGVVHNYLEGTTKEKSVIVSRSYVKDETGAVVAGVAQVKFRLQTLDIAKKLMSEYAKLKYYEEEYKNYSGNRYNFSDVVGSSSIFMEKKKEGMKAAKTNFTVLLTGETGTGKEVFAKAIHNSSNRADKPMISINCAAIPADLLESELFGYAEGAFTGAKRGGKKGKFIIANGGTIFLDEIGDMPITMQAKLLRVLQEKEVEPIGSLEAVPINVRVISATRKDLPKMVEEGTFREDLFYRLNVLNIHMIALRDRQDDILELANYFLNQLNVEYKQAKVLSKGVKKCFIHYPWAGNIRELDNVIKSAYAICDNFEIELTDLPTKMVSRHQISNTEQNNTKLLANMVDEYEKGIILDILRKNQWNCQIAAAELGIHRSIIYKKMKKHGIRKTY